MKRIIAIACVCLAGCATVRCQPKYSTNWSKLEVGLTKEAVVALLGEPSSCADSIQVDPQQDQSVIETLAGTVIVRTLFDGWFERWHYGQFEMFDNFLQPSDKAYVVYFNGQGTVVKFRQPLAIREQNKTSNKPDASRTSTETIDFRVRIRDKSSDEKVITSANLIRIKQFILNQGLRETYCNMYNNNPAFRTKSYSFYLNPDTGPENINCETDKSDFHTLTIRKSGGGKNQYRTVEFLDKHYVYIVVSWPTKDLTVSQAREFVVEAIKDILKEIEKEKPNKTDAGDGK